VVAEAEGLINGGADRLPPPGVVAGIVQTALYLDFFYNYINAKRQNIDAPIELPA
jgi:hypothetical protein